MRAKKEEEKKKQTITGHNSSLNGAEKYLGRVSHGSLAQTMPHRR